jgi:hypothetical protein
LQYFNYNDENNDYLSYFSYMLSQDRTPSLSFHASIQEGKPELIHFWLKQDTAIIDRQDAEGNTALMIAAEHGQLQILELLLNHQPRPDLNLKNKRGDTALLKALQGSLIDPEKGIHAQYLTIIRQLLMYGANPSQVDSYGKTGLDYFIEYMQNALFSLHIDHHGAYIKKSQNQLYHHYRQGLKTLILAGALVDPHYIFNPKTEELYKQNSKDLRNQNQYALQTLKSAMYRAHQDPSYWNIYRCLMYPQLKRIVTNTLKLKQMVEHHFAYLDKRVIRHILLLPSKEIAYFLEIERIIFKHQLKLKKPLPQEIIHQILKEVTGFTESPISALHP